jgi:RNA polymerase sigma-70 factor (ECF subfamily)
MTMDDTADPERDEDARLSRLMALAQAGDQSAYTQLLRDCVPLVRRVGSRRGLAGDLLDDAVQDTLLTVHNARQTYDPGRSFIAWLSVIAARRAIDVVRRRDRAGRRELHAPLAYESYADPAADTGRGPPIDGLKRRLGDAIGQLPDGQREAVEHIGLKERTLAETSIATGRTSGALKVNFHRALKSLRAKLGSGD